MADPKPSSTQWFIQAQDQRLGPYTSEQVETLVESGSIPNTAVATCDRLGGAWISVQEVFRGSAPPSSAPNEATYSSFRPPARPSQITQQHAPQPIEEEDPTLPLLDALQAAKERKSAKEEARQSTTATQWDPVHDKKPKRIYWIAGALCIALTGVIWAGVRLFSQSDAEPPKITHTLKKAPQPKPVVTAPRGQLMTAPRVKPPPRPVTRPRPEPIMKSRSAAQDRNQRLDREDRREDDLPRPEGEPQNPPHERPIDAPREDEPVPPPEDLPMEPNLEPGLEPEGPVVDEPFDNY